MRHGLFALLMLSPITHATSLEMVQACDDALVSFESVDVPVDLPDPRNVHPEREHEILAFIDALVPLPSTETVFGLEMTLKKFVSLYRPKLSASEISALLQPHRPSRMALRCILGAMYPGRRIDIARLRLFWISFVAEVCPDAPPPDPMMIHRAEVMLLRQSAGGIAAFMRDHLKLDTRNDVASVSRGLAQLYAAHRPDLVPPEIDLHPYGKKEKDAEIVARWNAYVAAVTEGHTSEPPARDRLPIEPVHGVDPTRDSAEVPDHAGAILEYLALRFRHIHPRENHSIVQFLNALRAELDLGPTAVKFRRKDFTNIWHNDSPEASRTLRTEWQDIMAARRERRLVE